ncbi:MAG: response regulator [candidate division Zixibacteria bacterium]|nr:response regulator [candidate division Zixibacteria bacterium]MDH3938313.1 response regulator [candidate division Zixibacteria bacterium]MDH4034644.1 response regulator [candidate division Zixibacteria bacterium]
MKALNRMKLLSELGKDSRSYKGDRVSTSRRLMRTTDLRKSILVIDDQPEMVESLSEYLSYGGYKPHGALSVKEGIEKLQRYGDICLIVCDLMMPEDDGYSMLEFLKGSLRFRHIPIIVSTSLNDMDAIDKASRLGVREYLIKPYTSEMFLSRIRDTLLLGLGSILIVTESSTSSKLLSTALSRIGYRVLSAENGNVALEILHQKPVNGVLSELALVDMTGLHLMLQVQDIQTGIPFLFIEDHLLELAECDVISAGGHGILRKPFNNADVVRRVAHLLSDRKTLLGPRG